MIVVVVVVGVGSQLALDVQRAPRRLLSAGLHAPTPPPQAGLFWFRLSALFNASGKTALGTFSYSRLFSFKCHVVQFIPPHSRRTFPKLLRTRISCRGR